MGTAGAVMASASDLRRCEQWVLRWKRDACQRRDQTHVPWDTAAVTSAAAVSFQPQIFEIGVPMQVNVGSGVIGEAHFLRYAAVYALQGLLTGSRLCVQEEPLGGPAATKDFRE